MLLGLHVKNLALIEETEVEFGKGLNILTGETGAGKSVLLGSVNLALGGKFEKDMLRKGTEDALVELTFSCEEEMEDTGYEDYFYGEGVCLVDWAELVKDLIPQDAIWITVEKDYSKDDDYRLITLRQED